MNIKKHAKRMLSVLLSVCTLLSTVVTAQAASSDIGGHWAEKQMQAFINQGLLSGYGDGTYGPDDVITRSQFAALVNAAAGLTAETEISAYTDVAESAWYYSALKKALAAGYMQGTSSNTLAPEAMVTREQAVTMLAKLLGMSPAEEDDRALNRYSDLDQVSDWAVEPFAAVVKSGYVTGTSETTLSPKAPLTRAQGVTILYNALDLLRGLASGSLVDGVYTGTGAGYGGTITVQMTVENGKITNLEVISHKETFAYFRQAQSVLSSVLEKQTTEGVDAVSGATKTSNGLLTAVSACISQAKGGEDTSKTGSTGSGGGGKGDSTPTEGEDFLGALADGTYTGSAVGYSGTTQVTVTVEGGKITDVTIDSHGDTTSYFNRSMAVIDGVIAEQSTDVDVVSGATYSSYGILNAINDALKEAIPSREKSYQVANWSEFTTALAKAVEGDTIQLTADITDAGEDYKDLVIVNEDGTTTSYDSLVDAVSSATLGMATISKPITIDGNGHSISAGEDMAYCFNISGSGVVMKDLTIDGASYGARMGGGLYLAGSRNATATTSLVLDSVTIKNCKSYKSSMPGNGGGAIYCKGAVALKATNCTFEGNEIVKAGFGGAILAQGATVTLTDCTFTGNKAPYGGAIAATGTANLTVTGCTFTAEGKTDNEAAYGGDDIYIFDGKTPGKSGSFSDSAVVYALSGNTYSTDGESWEDYAVVLGRYLVDESTEEGGKNYAGSGNTIFASGHDLTFTGWDRTELLSENKNEYTFVLMNIPYHAFYAAEGVSGVDAVTSATVKTYNQSMAGGSYHAGYAAAEPIGSAEILGVTYPVYVENLSDLANQLQVTDQSSATITVASGKSSLVDKEVSGVDLLFASGDYAFYVMTSEPSSYKTLTVNEDGSFSFSAASAKPVSGESMEVEMAYDAHYTNIEFNVTAAEITDSCVVNAITLTTSDGEEYALRHVEDIWRKTSLGWNWNSLDGNGLAGKTITKVTYYIVDNGVYKIYEYAVNETVKLNPGEITASFQDANTIAVTGLPEDIQNAKATVQTKVGRGQTATVIAENVDVVNGKIVTTTSTEIGTYTISVASDNYGDVSAEAEYVLTGSGYVLMNVPYDAFYAGEGVADVDAVTSATVKTYNQTMAGGSYHAGYAAAEPIGSAEILGVTYPVYVADLSILTGKTQVTDQSSSTITVASGKSSLVDKEVSGVDLLFASGNYAFYVLAEEPSSYKTLTVNQDGSFGFSAASPETTVAEGMEVEMAYGAHYTNIEFSVTAAEITDSCVVNAITLTTSDGEEYALRHVEDIWRKTSLGWNWNSLDGNGLAGKTITKVTYYIVDNGVYRIYEYAVNETVKLNPGEITAAFEGANTVVVTGLPADMENAKATVKTTVGRGQTATVIAENVAVVDGKITTTAAAEAGNYTITIVSDDYGDVSTTADYTVE